MMKVSKFTIHPVCRQVAIEQLIENAPIVLNSGRNPIQANHSIFFNLLFIGLFSLLFSTSYAQNKKFSIGAIAGVSNYQGDLIKEDFSFKALHLTLGVEANYDINRLFSIKPMLYYGKISGSDHYYTDRKARGYSTETTIVEFASSLQLNPLNLFSTHDYLLTPKVFLGAGIVHYDASTDNIPSNTTHNMNNQLLNGSFHWGANVFYQINEKHFIGFEMSNRSLLNDKIDGVSIGNKKNNDWYYLTNFIFSIKI